MVNFAVLVVVVVVVVVIVAAAVVAIVEAVAVAPVALELAISLVIPWLTLVVPVVALIVPPLVASKLAVARTHPSSIAFVGSVLLKLTSVRSLTVAYSMAPHDAGSALFERNNML